MFFGVLALVAVLFVYAWVVEPLRLRLRRYQVPVAEGQLSQPIRILFISDFHCNALNNSSALRRHLRALKSEHNLSPFHLILLGGDFLDFSARYIPEVGRVVSEVANWGMPCYAVLGNHDHFSTESVSPLVETLEKAGVKVLRDQSEVIKLGGQEVVLIGLEDIECHAAYQPKNGKSLSPAQYAKGAGKLKVLQEFDNLRPELPRILLSHNPDAVHIPRMVAPTLILSGHTHGGQVWPLEKIGAHVHKLMPRGSFVAWAGSRLLNKTFLIISRGIGGSLLPLRFLCPPEAVVATLQPTRVSRSLVIGLSGKARSGKDTAASMLETLLPGMTRIGFSFAIKEEYDRINGTNTRYDEHEKDRHRPGLNILGAEKRDIDPDYWVKKTMQQKPPMLCADVRLPQEAKAIKDAGGVLIRLEAPHVHLKKRLGEHHEKASHTDTETPLDDYQGWDYVIHNDGTLLDLERKVRHIYNDILNRFPN